MRQFEELRQAAEQILAGKNTADVAKQHVDINKLLHEISVHQIELEIQNEELRAAKLHSDQIQHHLAQLYHQAPVGYASLNAQAMIIEANNTFSHLLDVTLEALQGKSITDFMPPVEKNIFLLRYQSFYQHPQGKQIETCLLTQNQKIIPVRLDGRISEPTLVHHDEKQVLLISVTDISEIKKSQQLLVCAKEEAELANMAKSQFLSQMSHNLRTPMNAILGFAQLLELYQAVPLSDEQCEYVAHIIDAGQHLLALIDDVLNFAKIEAGKIVLTQDNVNLHKVLKQQVDLIRPTAAQRNISIHYTPGDKSLVLAADSTRLKEVLLNLLSNAIKYNHQGGAIELSYQCNDGNCRIAIKDSGIGLSHEQQLRLFKPFERLGAENSSIEGTGIGLAICKYLIDAMQGSIGVDSLQGEGCTFWIELPISHNQSETFSTQPPVTTETNREHRTILYIEDNPANMELMTAYFGNQKNMTLLKASGAAYGLELAARQQPDVILLDIKLPEINVFEVFRNLRNNPLTHDIPIIAVSAYAMPEDAKAAMKLGFYDYITKPFNFQSLLKSINAAFVEHAGS